MKTCTKCKQEKPLDEFSKSKDCKLGRHSRCKVCRATESGIWAKKNPEKVREWVNNNQEHIKEYRKDNRERARIYTRNSRLKRFYGVSQEEYAQMRLNQNNKCAICGKEETSKSKEDGKVRDLSVDHSHMTGKVRGLLCFRCNIVLGKVEDSPELLTLMIAYLQR